MSDEAERATRQQASDAESTAIPFALTLPERLDRASASVLATAHRRIAAHSVQRLSFEHTRRLEPAGLEALLLFCKQAYEKQASVRLERLSAESLAVLSLCGFAALCRLLPAAEERASK